MDCRIYVLNDPRNHEPKYVGVTWDSLDKMLQRHMGEPGKGRLGRWLSKLKQQNLVAEIRELEQVHDCDWREAEEEWIGRYRDQGAALLQMNPKPRDGFLSDTHKKRISEGLRQKYRKDPDYRKKVGRAVSQYHQLMARRRIDSLRAARDAAKEE